MVFAAAWAYGVTGLFAALDPLVTRWRPGAGAAVAAVTVFADLLLMRALDDVRDLGYDRRFNPGRPLASGAVRVRDLGVLYAAGSLAVLALNAARPWQAAVLAVQLAYGAVVVAAHCRWGRPSGDRLLVNLLVSLPAPVLLHAYLYAGYLHAVGHDAGRAGLVAVAVAVLAAGHAEVAKNFTRTPRPGERTYAAALGLRGSVALALAAPALSAALLAARSQAPPAWTLAALLPLVVPAAAGYRFLRGRTRWPPSAPALHLLLTFTGYAALGLAR
jgi:4-hydroxybenzoate polyprenyltransferase